MQYTRLGDTGLIVSRLTFGTMTFGEVTDGWRRVAKVDTALAKDLVDKCLDAGINFFDTANSYAAGQSEVMLGKALGKRRQDVVIATKVGFRSNDHMTRVGLGRRNIMLSVQESLDRLGTDYIDLYLVHRMDPVTPLEETLEALNDLVRLGMVRHVGFSNWTAWRAAQAVGLQQQHGWAKFMAAQMYYSLLGRDLEHEVAPFVQEAGIGTMIWSGLAGGFLTGKYTRESVAAELAEAAQASELEDETAPLPRIVNPGNEFIPFDQEHAFQVVDMLREMAGRYDASVAQLALAWLLAKKHVSTVVIGASKLHQLEDNLGAVEIEFSAEDLQALDDLTAPTELYPNWFATRTPEGVWDLVS